MSLASLTATYTDSDDDPQPPSRPPSPPLSPRIPPQPPAKCPPELEDRIRRLYEKKEAGALEMNSVIQRNKNFRNPSIYEKLVKFCDIDELGSNYPKEVFDPHEFHPSSFYDELAKAQKAEMERREKERKDRTKVEFVSATKPPAEEPAKRKSKWDQRAPLPPTAAATAASLLQARTVISAFGNIAKPPAK